MGRRLGGMEVDPPALLAKEKTFMKLALVIGYERAQKIKEPLQTAVALLGGTTMAPLQFKGVEELRSLLADIESLDQNYDPESDPNPLPPHG
jgi:hypothetical protein